MNVRLRSLQQDDADDVLRGWQDNAVQECLLLPMEFPATIEDAKAFIYFAGGKASSGRDFAIDVDGRFAGKMLWRYGQGVFSHCAEIGYWVLPEFRSMGVAKKAIECAQEFLFERRRVHRIEARVSGLNVISQSLLLHTGFMLEGVHREALLIRGKLHDCYIYACINCKNDSNQM